MQKIKPRQCQFIRSFNTKIYIVPLQGVRLRALPTPVQPNNTDLSSRRNIWEWALSGKWSENQGEIISDWGTKHRESTILPGGGADDRKLKEIFNTNKAKMSSTT